MITPSWTVTPVGRRFRATRLEHDAQAFISSQVVLGIVDDADIAINLVQRDERCWNAWEALAVSVKRTA